MTKKILVEPKHTHNGNFTCFGLGYWRATQEIMFNDLSSFFNVFTLFGVLFSVFLFHLLRQK